MTNDATRQERIYTALQHAEEALRFTESGLWADMWNEIEQDMLRRLLALGPDDDDARWRVSQAIDVARRMKAMASHKAQTRDTLLKELDLLEGRKQPPIA